MEGGINKSRAEHSENDDPQSLPHQTPSRRRVNLGAPANYYFKYVNSGKKKAGDTNDSMLTSQEDGDTGTISIPGITLGGGGDQTETSYLSMAASSSGSEASDLLNKSTLSDTTELTASNFVLTTTSKQQMARSIYKTDRAAKAERALEILRSQFSPEKRPKSALNEGDSKKVVDIKNDGGPATPAGSENPISLAYPGGSPSLKSRISSSPAGLKKFQEGLKITRMKRQMQREVDAKRRLSSESVSSIPDMHAQLEALTTDTNYTRQRLPPTSTRHLPLFEEVSTSRSRQLSATEPSLFSAAKDTTTSFVNMDELDDLLGATVAERMTQSSITARRSSIERVLGSEKTQENDSASPFSHEKLLSGDRRNSPFERSTKSPSFPASIGMPLATFGSRALNQGSQKSDETQARSSFISSPNISPEREINESQLKLKSSSLSSSPRRIANPQSIFSPAKNTRSAKKARKQESDLSLCHQDLSLSPRRHSMGSGTKSCVAPLGGRLSLALSVGGASERSNETASPGDFQDLFGEKEENTGNSANENTGNSANENLFDDDPGDTGDVLNSVRDQGRGIFEETASLGDINEILGTQSGDYGESCQTDAEEEDQMNEYNPTENSEEHSLKLSGKEDKRTISSLYHQTIDSSTKITDQSSPSKEHEMVSNPRDRRVSNQKDHLLSEITVGGIESSNKRSAEPEPTTLEGSSPMTPPKVDLTALSPGADRLMLRSDTRSPSEGSKFSGETAQNTNSARFSESAEKNPMRLTPNSHVAPTPTKLAPTPRRVLNPSNPNSPARNTRSSSKNGRSPLAQMSSPLELSADKRPRDDLAKPAKLFQIRGDNFPSNKRRRSSVLATPASVKNEPKPHGIMSSKKKAFSSQRTVAFGSPKAAEYNIGSPSVSLTPMPRGRAKALYRLPVGIENNVGADDAAFLNQSSNGSNKEEETISIESDINILVDKISVENMQDSPELSPIAKVHPVASVCTHREESQGAANTIPSSPSSLGRKNTVELEIGMDSLLAKTLENSPSINAEFSRHDQTTEQENSLEMIDTDSIASIHSRRSEKYTADFAIPLNGQKLDFSSLTGASVGHSEQIDMDIDEGDTEELEGDITSMLKNQTDSTGKASDNEQDELLIFSEDDTSPAQGSDETQTGILSSLLDENKISRPQDGQTIELEDSMATERRDPVVENHNETISDTISADNGQTFTVEIESNMTELLIDAREAADTENTESDSLSMIDAGPEREGEKELLYEKSSRKSLASSTFSLHQPDQVQVSLDDAEQQSFVVNEKSVSFCDTAEFIESIISSPHDSENETPDRTMITEKERSNLTESMFRELAAQSSLKSNIAPDDLLQFVQSTSDTGKVIFERLRQFVEAVCNEVEKNTDSEGTANFAFLTFTDKQPFLCRDLNEKMFVGSEARKSFDSVVNKGREALDFEWKEWLDTVLHSFHGPLSSIPSMLVADSDGLDGLLKECQKHQQSLMMAFNQKNLRAKQKMLARHHSSVSDVERDIRLIEEKSHVLESEISLLQREEAELEDEKSSVKELGRLVSDCDLIRSDAEGSQKTYLSLRGMHSWSLGKLDGTELRISIPGTCEQTSTSVSYAREKNDKIKPNILPQPTVALSNSHFRYNDSISSFLDECMERLFEYSRYRSFDDSTAIFDHVQKYAWESGRLDLTAKELHVLRRRYKAKLVRTNSEMFSLDVLFTSKSASVEINLALDPLYPSFPVDVRLDLIRGELDLKVIQKSLIKQAKPGFGSLSRVCDIIESFVKDADKNR